MYTDGIRTVTSGMMMIDPRSYYNSIGGHHCKVTPGISRSHIYIFTRST